MEFLVIVLKFQYTSSPPSCAINYILCCCFFFVSLNHQQRKILIFVLRRLSTKRWNVDREPSSCANQLHAPVRSSVNALDNIVWIGYFRDQMFVAIAANVHVLLAELYGYLRHTNKSKLINGYWAGESSQNYRWTWDRDDRLLRKVFHHFQCLIVIIDHVPHEHVANHADDAQPDRCE